MQVVEVRRHLLDVAGTRPGPDHRQPRRDELARHHPYRATGADVDAGLRTLLQQQQEDPRLVGGQLPQHPFVRRMAGLAGPHVPGALEQLRAPLAQRLRARLLGVHEPAGHDRARGATGRLADRAERLRGSQQRGADRGPAADRTGEVGDDLGRLGGLLGQVRSLVAVGGRSGEPLGGADVAAHAPLAGVPGRGRGDPGQAGQRLDDGGDLLRQRARGLLPRRGLGTTLGAIAHPPDTPKIHRCRKPPARPMIAPWA